jgi:cell division protein FtsZ
MIATGLKGVEFVALNSDQQALSRSRAPRRLRLGERLTRGLGAGGDAAVGARAAEECADEIRGVVRGADMVFIAAGMGGGTGTGASLVLAQIAQEAGVLTVGVVTRPFAFEGSRRRRTAEEGLLALQDRLHTLIIIPNDRVLQVIDKRTTVEMAFSVVDDVLRQGIQGISELITKPGLINLDFADVKSVMSESGIALMAIGSASGEDRAMQAAQLAMASPLLDLSMHGARGVLFNITGGPDLTLGEINQAADIIRQAADPDANIIFGAVIDESMGDEVRITVIATGFSSSAPRFGGPERPTFRSAFAAADTGEPGLSPFEVAEREGPPHGSLFPRLPASEDPAPAPPRWMRPPDLAG